jgi:hypothetical protein
MTPISPVALSPIDEKRFGIRIARASAITVESLPGVLEFCRQQSVGMLIARCAVADLAAAQAMEREGFLLMDTLVYYARDLRHPPLPRPSAEPIVRPCRPKDEPRVRQIAAEAFRAYLGHYHADPRLDRRLCDEAYA